MRHQPQSAAGTLGLLWLEVASASSKEMTPWRVISERVRLRRYRTPGKWRFGLTAGSVGIRTPSRSATRLCEDESMRPLVAIIDDDEALCLSLVDLMRSIGYGAEPYGSAETFLSSSDLSSLDCIVVDVHMPGMGGLKLAKELHEQGFVVPIIIITALPDKSLDSEAASAGARCVLRKPFETSTLIDCVERSLVK
jgi:CheY-like chemotaxis protein